jgi:hypothetical protein
MHEDDEEDYVTPSDLRIVLTRIIQDFPDEEVRQKTRSALLRLYREFSKRELKRLRGSRINVE